MPGLPLIASPAVDDATAALVRQVLHQVLQSGAAGLRLRVLRVSARVAT
jgi:hypothetical protein